ncbi:hypothetical protein N161109_046 [Synechococcus phage S-CAM9]|uniref:Uncharacterized protein n=1 Tax=Synechococcus phage S-CAM9 TaxID=1883369 RepID=A0A1D8KPQ1_9CAUD|nr:hypothetical protein BOW85_gp203 [Synechococcus phage S-CAM9]AOV60195.1 hypothetical protein S050808_047 [Synechococcus phage S-CAM9]AOV60650.1 hypothetical protein N161109_046 [Synechococcus phage S-CAM9]
MIHSVDGAGFVCDDHGCSSQHGQYKRFETLWQVSRPVPQQAQTKPGLNS